MILEILRTARSAHIRSAMGWVSDQLHVPAALVTEHVAVAYVCKHFEQGTYTGWDGWVDMLEADA